MKKYFALIAVPLMSIIFACTGSKDTPAENVYAIIPTPVSIAQLKGSFVFTPKTRIIVNKLTDETRLAADFLALMVNRVSGSEISVEEGTKSSRGSVSMIIDEASGTGTEGYILTVTPKGITIKAEAATGLFYAVQSIRQLLPPEVESPLAVAGIELTVPACEIHDNPRFVYRGMHLDVGRHMFPVEYIKRYIDMIALHKMNTFHWHLTEDQGWRIEIKKYPLLTEVGGFRKETLIGHGGKKPFVYDGKPYGGFYTQEEVKEIVEYARQRFITVIPEIEMPGHSVAALSAYPELSWRGIKGGIAAAREGHDVIMTPSSHLYLDHYQTEPAGQPLGIGGYSPLEWVYSYEPIPEELTEEQQKYILGLQGNLWSEYLSTPDHMEYMAYPRMFAIAETGWSPAMKKDFEEFLARFTYQTPRYDVAGINYFKGDYRNTRGREK